MKSPADGNRYYTRCITIYERLKTVINKRAHGLSKADISSYLKPVIDIKVVLLLTSELKEKLKQIESGKHNN